MTDIVTRLRTWVHAVDAVPASDLMDEAADAVESLRREVREQRSEIAGLREERRALLEADRPQPDRPKAIEMGESDRPKPICTPEPHAAPGEGSVHGE